MLKAECDRGGVEWRMPCPVDGVTREGDAWRVATPRGRVRARTRSSSRPAASRCPKIGATPFGYRIAEQFGLAVVPPRPALVPLALPPEALARYGDLAGVSVDVEVACGGGRFRENLLFTHRGLSGPAILQISSYWNGKAPLAIDLLPGDRRRRHGSSASARRPRGSPPCSPSGCRSASRSSGAPRTTSRGRCKQLPERRLRELAAALRCWKLLPVGHARLQQGRGHAGRRRHARAVVARRWRRPACRASTSSAKSSTSPAGSAATISSGRGPRVTRRA